jgi:hypothetical protein
MGRHERLRDFNRETDIDISEFPNFDLRAPLTQSPVGAV